MTIDIELKEYPHGGRDAIAFDVCDRVLAMVDEYGFTDRIVINTFDAKLHLVERFDAVQKKCTSYSEILQKTAEGVRDAEAKQSVLEIADLLKNLSV